MIPYIFIGLIALILGFLAGMMVRKSQAVKTNGQLSNEIFQNLVSDMDNLPEVILNTDRMIRNTVSNLKNLLSIIDVFVIDTYFDPFQELTGNEIPRISNLKQEIFKLRASMIEDYIELDSDSETARLLIDSPSPNIRLRIYPVHIPNITHLYYMIIIYDPRKKEDMFETVMNIKKSQILMPLYLNELYNKQRYNSELLDNVFYKGPVTMCISDDQGKILRFNRLFHEMFKKDLTSIKHTLKEFVDIIKEGKNIEQDLEFHSKFIKARGVPLYDKSGEVKGGVFIFIDESIQRLLFNKLEISEKRYRKLIKKLPIGLAIINRGGMIYFVNDNFMHSLGFNDFGQMQGKNLTEFFDMTEDTINQISYDFERREYISYRLQSKSEYGERIFSIYLRKVEIGEEELIEGVFQDISLETTLYSQLNEKNKLLEEELSTAKVVQEHILSIPTVYTPGIRFKTFYMPSHQLGGDFYDIVQIDENHLGVIMADVSGHGVSASLIASMLKILVEFGPKDPHRLDEMLNYIHSGLIKIIPEDSYITMFYGIIDVQSYQMQYINCGHPFPVIYDMKKRESRLIEGMGFPMGTFRNTSYENLIHKTLLPESCKILFYSDGLMNFKNKSRVINFQDLRDFFVHNIDERNKTILNQIYVDIVRNSTRFADDDISMLLLILNKELNYKKFLSIPSNVMEIDLAIVRILEEIGRKWKMSEEMVWRIYTALYEGMINAVEHGNKFDVQKRVTVVYRLFFDWLAIKVRDEGPGFQFNKVPSPLEEKNLMKPSGRGVYMIRKLMDKVHYNRSGNEVTMFIKLSEEESGVQNAEA